MIVQSHSPENRRVPKREPWNVLVHRITFVLVAWAIAFFLAYHVAGAVRTPGNPFYEVMK